MSHTDPYASHPGDHHYSPEELHNLDVAHEHSDVNVRTILMYAGGLAVVTAIVLTIVWGVFLVLEHQAAQNDPELSPVARPAAQMPARTTESPFFGEAAGPKLLTNEYRVLAEERAREAEALKGIEDAKRRAIGELPVRATGPADDRLGTYAPARGESSGGRKIVVR